MLGILSDIGNVREINEDFVDYYEGDRFKIYIVADGMGGHNAGEVASKLAVEETIDYVKYYEDLKDMKTLLIDAIEYANTKIYNYAKEKEKFKGMGTTITCCILDNNGNMIVANVGDSSCYILAKGGVKKITKDHSYVQQLLDEGTITKEEANTHPNKNVITRALGTNLSVQVDTFNIKLNEVCKVLLCTDGLTNYANEQEMCDILLRNEKNNEETCKQLVELSKLKGGKDNISVILFEGECEYDRNQIR
ncbi:MULTISPECIES: Stp1/IreP family PP2C-type Ser/Thr phosphatase [Clostridium]|uniref:protein-serine/threonine phosphatase n=2 Tax=Clostridium TaxID=1485 RepID=A0A7U4JQA7_CLOSG|nr:MULTISPECIES: Stp1/IreP family PP2C-type Ser/Thr phosphatase [Clostridium]AJD32282.1 stage II sporulation E family protein [Clostridium botulinum Prevot_594]AVP61199.1 Stp1/IreP family PP2C-type Ser/Thr phosphatase [Clostridium botulinum]AKC63319.1 protein phosphatase PrpC [Clostridium sporogenes]AKJ90502.1 protein phosphatase [Clostridium sporogenes]AVP66134.1 Stp1/IreP family PP2C-type Ser/Thr phosphatase [Clostridium botulinum]